MLFRQIFNDHLAHAAYLIGCQRTGEALLVDPARDVDCYVELARAHGLKIVAVAETHIHADFLSGSRELAEAVGARLFLSDEGGADWKYGWVGQHGNGEPLDVVLVRDGDQFKVGKIELRVVHSPGHTPEHISFLVTDVGGGADAPIGMLTGDFVFVGDLGRPDLLETAAGIAGVKESAARTLAGSATRFLKQPDYLQVWPAHGAGSACGKALGAVPQSTVGYERRFNPALKIAGNERAFVDYILDGQPEPPLYFRRMKMQNRDGVPLLGQLPSPRELTGEQIAELDGTRLAIVDTRPWNEFQAGHINGSLFAPLGTVFHTIVGSYIEPGDEIVVVAEADQVESIVRELVRIGLDRVTAFVTPTTLSSSEMKLASIPELDVDAAREAMREGKVALIDVRRAAELSAGSIAAGAPQIAHTRLPERLAELPENGALLVYCATGRRSGAAAAYLRRAGYNALNLAGGFGAWRRAEQARSTMKSAG